jgi:hypothetical protein
MTGQGDGHDNGLLLKVFKLHYSAQRPTDLPNPSTRFPNIKCWPTLTSMAIDMATNDCNSIALNFEKVILL